MMETKLIILVVLVSLLLFFNNNNAIMIKMTNAVCESYNKSCVDIQECRLRAIRRNKTVLNLRIDLLEPAKNISVRMQIQKKANGYKPWLVDVTFDACRFMKRNNNKMVQIFSNLIRNYSTINHTCPYSGLQVIKDFYAIPKNIPLVIPTGDYVLLLSWTLNQKLQLVTNIYFSYVEDF